MSSAIPYVESVKRAKRDGDELQRSAAHRPLQRPPVAARRGLAPIAQDDLHRVPGPIRNDRDRVWVDEVAVHRGLRDAPAAPIWIGNRDVVRGGVDSPRNRTVAPR